VFEHVLEAIADAVVVVDIEGRITIANTAATTVSGYTMDELRALPIATLLVDESSGLRTVVRRRIEEGDVLRREQSWLVTKAGERVPVSVTGSPVLSKQGALEGIVLVARDVREIRQLLADNVVEIAARTHAENALRAAMASIEDQLEESRTQLLLAERRATLGTLAGGVGHELRNIAQIQVAAVDEITEALARNEDVRPLLKILLPNLERVGDHITSHGQRLMQLARPGPDRVAPIDLHTVVHDVVAMLKSAGKLRRHDVVISVGADVLQVTVNRTRIEQILVNLIVNAVDAIGDTAGRITIAVTPQPDGKRVICTVTDTGPGIPVEQLEKIFEPFFTTKPAEQGTGLGLPVAREIVQTYGGNLTVTTELGRGTTFTFDLPR